MQALISRVVEARHFFIDYNNQVQIAGTKIRDNLCNNCHEKLTNLAKVEENQT